MSRLKILTWHIHGSYLYYLSHVDHDFFLPITAEPALGYYGRTEAYPWPANVHEVPAHLVKDMHFDCVIYQHRQNWIVDRDTILSSDQRAGPQIYVEHDPPRETPTNTKHVVDDPNVLLVHVTPFNELMWDNNRTPTRVIQHGVVVPPSIRYTGDVARACVVINNLQARGRRLGLDIFGEARERFPLDLVGIGWEQVGGIGEFSHVDLLSFMKDYRFFFNPIRYTSLGLAVCEAMMIGLPILGLATTEMVMAVKNGINGFVETDRFKLYQHMSRLLADPSEARCLSKGARQIASENFHIDRFRRDWNRAIDEVTGRHRSPVSQLTSSSKVAHASLNDQ